VRLKAVLVTAPERLPWPRRPTPTCHGGV